MFVISEGTKFVFQKKQAFAKARKEIIRKKVKELLEAGIIKPIDFPECPSNPVVMAKAGGAWRVCIDLIGLNKAILKNPHPLPVIDQLVDSVAGHKLLSFLDAYKGYYQIPMAKEDMAKTTFVTDDGIYYYTRMLVWLKKCWSVLPGGHEQSL